MVFVILGIYALSLTFILVYSFIQLSLTVAYKKKYIVAEGEKTPKFNEIEDLPFVTIQLPIYNEKYVAERLLESVSNIKYPKNKLEIQVLDDSNDETVEIIKQAVEKIKAEGHNIIIHYRQNRNEYKAGALKEGLKTAKGELIAIFDADFLPSSDFLEKTIPEFNSKKVGMVQTRWAHINRNYSVLTRVQAFGLDAHFTIDQGGRFKANHFISFNGTAGIWRKKCIVDAGNWDGSTLSEDLDLSYRAQFIGWKMIYLEDVESPAELPVALSALKTQQYRWNKGTAETFQRMKSKIIHDKNMNFLNKIHGFFHLLSSSVFINVFIVSFLSVPIVYFNYKNPSLDNLFAFSSIFTISTIILASSYWVYYSKLHGNNLKVFSRYVKEFFMFMSIITSFAFHNAIAAIEGHLGKKTAFVRTPKFNINNKSDKWSLNKYLIKKISFKEWTEGFLALYFLAGIFTGIYLKQYGLIPFHFLVFSGYSYLFYNSVWKN